MKKIAEILRAVANCIDKPKHKESEVCLVVDVDTTKAEKKLAAFMEVLKSIENQMAGMKL